MLCDVEITLARFQTMEHGAIDIGVGEGMDKERSMDAAYCADYMR